MKTTVSEVRGDATEPVLTEIAASKKTGSTVEMQTGSMAPHVLVVEDDPVILELLQDVLSGAGFKVLVAKTAVDGLALFQQYSDSTFCVILDYGIPGMHAARLFERLTDLDPEVKVILSSGYPQHFIVEDFPMEKIAGFMVKPYDPQILISELERLSPGKTPRQS